MTELVLNFAIKGEFKTAYNLETFNKEVPQKWNLQSFSYSILKEDKLKERENNNKNEQFYRNLGITLQKHCSLKGKNLPNRGNRFDGVESSFPTATLHFPACPKKYYKLHYINLINN